MSYIISEPNEQKNELLKILEKKGYNCKDENGKIVLYCDECNLLQAQSLAMIHQMIFKEIKKDLTNTNFY